MNAHLAERLEPRRLLAAVAWDGGGDGTSWTDPLNWSTNSLPTTADDVTINVAANPTITVDSGTQSVRSLTSAEALRIDGGTLAPATASTLNAALTLAGGELAGGGNLTVNGAFVWSGGNMTGTGTTRVNGTSTLDVPASNYLYVRDSRRLVLNGASTLGGAGFVQGYGLAMYDASTIEVATGRTLTLTDGARLLNFGGTPTLVNNGTVGKAGAGEATVGVLLDNNGAVNVNAGTLALTGGGDSAGAITAAAGAGLDVQGDLSLSSGWSFAGAGTFRVNNGTLDVRANGSAPNLTLAGGTLTGNAALTINGPFNWSGGGMAGGGTTRVNGPSTLDVPSGTYLTLRDSRRLVLNGTGTLRGDGFAQGYGVAMYDAGALEVAAGRTLTLRDGAKLYDFGGAPTLVNNGTLRKAGGEEAVVGVLFDNNGTLNVDAGTLALSGGGDSGAAINVAAGAALALNSSFTVGGPLAGAGTVRFGGGTVEVNATYNVTGSTEFLGGIVDFNPSATLTSLGSALSISGGEANFSSGEDLAVASFALTGGRLAGDADVTVSGPLDWSGGAMAGGGTTRVNGPSTLDVPSGTYLTLQEARRLVLNGASTLGGAGFAQGYGLAMYDASVLEVASGRTLTLRDGAKLYNFGGGPTLVNNGTIDKIGPEEAAVGLRLDNNGTINVAAGTLGLTGGGDSATTINVAANSTLRLGGDFTFGGGGGLAGAGLIDFAGGTHTFAGNFAVTSPVTITSATVNFESAQTLAALTLAGGTLGGGGNVTVNGPFSWSGGAMAGGGTTRVNGPSTLDVPSGTYLRLRDSRRLVLNGASTLGGAGFVQGYGVAMYDASVIEVATGRTLTLRDGARVYNFGGSPTLVNNGTVVNTGTDESTVGVAFDNNGTVNVSAGALYLSGGGDSATTINVAANSTLRLGGDFTFGGGGGGLAGAGLIDFVNGTHTFSGNFAVTSPVTIASAAVSFNSAQTLAALALTGGSLGGSGNVTVSGALAWSGGAMVGGGTTRVNGPSTLDVPSGTYLTLRDSRRLVLNGASTLGGTGFAQGYGVAMYDSGTLEVASGRTLTLRNGAKLYNFGGTPALVNNGTLRKAGPEGADVNVAIENDGTIEVADGTLSVGHGGADGSTFGDGVIFVEPGATLAAGFTVRTLAADVTVAGGATIMGFDNLDNLKGRLALEGGEDLTVTPQNGSPGTLLIEGVLDLSPGSTFTVNGDISFDGVGQPLIRSEAASAGNRGLLVATGDIDLTGIESPFRLDVDLVNGFAPAVGTQFDVIRGSTVAGEIGGFFGDGVPSGHLEVGRDGDSVFVRVVTGAIPPAPRLLGVDYAFETGQVLTFAFDQNVSAFISRRDFSLANLTTGQTLDRQTGAFAYNPTSNRATLTLTNLLSDGNWRLSVMADDISNAAGVPLTTPLVFDFFVLAGDFNRDRAVNLSDFTILANNFGRTGRVFSQGDANYDGQVNLADFTVLANRFGNTLPASDDDAGLFD